MGKNNMRKSIKQTSPLLVAILGIWFVANLASQLVFISIHGSPYDGLAMLMSLGSIYIAILIAEAILWVWVLFYVAYKTYNHIIPTNSSDITGNGQMVTKST
ncbi:MAG: hypothetical protein HON10_08330 [Euryarchaeota archaeon]|jgi:hypothetical protein|nr:hypothetical protein [Euryarchaeota archaeon]MBT7987045.1 hypothetical protein [Euryarchaeota archaeon]